MTRSPLDPGRCVAPRRQRRARLRWALAWAALSLLVAASVAAPAVARAQQPSSTPPAVEASVAFTPLQASIGDRVTFTVTAHHRNDIILDAVTPKIERVDLLDTITPSTVDEPGGRQTTTFTWVLQPFRLGAIATGVVRLSWLRADGSNGDLEVAGTTLIIVPTRAEADDALRPPKPQVSIEGARPAWVRPATYAAAALAVALPLALIVLAVRRRRARTIEAPALDVTPERIARDALDRLLSVLRGADQDDDAYQEYYGNIALAVRGYLSARFGFNAHALTTTELERRTVAHGVDRWQARLVGGLLERCDAAVFARRYPDPTSADHDLTVAYEIVELSRPRPVRVEVEAAPA